MKIISFSAVEILPSLLDKSKVQTIRPLKIVTERVPKKVFYHLKRMDTFSGDKCYGKIIGGDEKTLEVTTQSFPRFHKEDKIKLIWKQRSKYKLFCSRCGQKVEIGFRETYHKCMFPVKEMDDIPKAYTFPKLLGTGTITEVFEIEMKWSKIDGFQYKPEDTDTWFSGFDDYIEELAKLDGFKSAEDMFIWFDKKYDLSTPKRFAVYWWRWN